MHQRHSEAFFLARLRSCRVVLGEDWRQLFNQPLHGEMPELAADGPQVSTVRRAGIEGYEEIGRSGLLDELLG